MGWLRSKLTQLVGYCGSFLDPQDKSTDIVLLAMAFGIVITSYLLCADFRYNHKLDKVCFPAFCTMIAGIHIFNRKGQGD